MMEFEVKSAIEALLFSSAQPWSVEKLAETLEIEDKQSVKDALTELQQDYEARVLELKEVASGYRFQVRGQHAKWIAKAWAEKPSKYSRAVLETLAIIAYRQPVTRADIEDIRGVSVSTSVMRTLLERQWVKVAGHRDVPGKPAIYITTKQFLDYFNLKRLDELPSIESILVDENEQKEIEQTSVTDGCAEEKQLQQELKFEQAVKLEEESEHQQDTELEQEFRNGSELESEAEQQGNENTRELEESS